MFKGNNKFFPGFILFITLILWFPVCARGEAALGINIGNLAPDFTLTSLAGKSVHLKDYRGKKPVYIVFWATWCPACLRGINPLKEAYRDLDKEKIELLSIDIGVRESREKLKLYKEKYSIPYPVLFDEGGVVSRSYTVLGIPTHILIDREGIIRYRAHTLCPGLSEYSGD